MLEPRRILSSTPSTDRKRLDLTDGPAVERFPLSQELGSHGLKRLRWSCSCRPEIRDISVKEVGSLHKSQQSNVHLVNRTGGSFLDSILALSVGTNSSSSRADIWSISSCIVCRFRSATVLLQSFSGVFCCHCTSHAFNLPPSPHISIDLTSVVQNIPRTLEHPDQIWFS